MLLKNDTEMAMRQIFEHDQKYLLKRLLDFLTDFILNNFSLVAYKHSPYQLQPIEHLPLC